MLGETMKKVRGGRRADIVKETCSNLLSRLLFVDPTTVSLFKWPDYFLFLWDKLSLTLIYVLLSQHRRERADVVEETRSNLLLFVAWLLYYSHFLFLLILSNLPLSQCFYHCLSVWYFKRCRLDQYSASWSRRQRIPCWQKISTANLTLRMVLVVERGVRDQDGLIRLIGIWVASSCPSW